MKELQVAVVIFSKSPAIAAVIGGIENYVQSRKLPLSIKVFNAGGPRLNVMIKYLERLTLEDADLVITIGTSSSQIAVESFNGRKYPLPTVFCAVAEEFVSEFQKQVDSRAYYLTGVYAEQVSSNMPMQMLFQLYPQMTRIFIPYLDDAKFGRMRFEVQQMIDYCNDRDVEVVAQAIDGMEDYEELYSSITQTDVTVALQGSLTGVDTEKIEALCKKADKPFIGDGQQAAESGGIYGFKEDYEFMGAKVAEYAERILCSGERPSSIPFYKAQLSLQFRPPTTPAIKQDGIFISENVLASYDGIMCGKEVKSRFLAVASPTEAVFAQSMYCFLIQALRYEHRVEYILRKYSGRLGDEYIFHAQCGKLLSGVYEHITFFDNHYARRVWDHAREHNLPMPPSVVVSVADETDSTEWHDEVRRAGGTLISVVVPAPDPVEPVRLLLEADPTIKRVTAFVKADLRKLPDYLQARFDAVKAYCNERGVTLRIVGSPVKEAFHEIRGREVTKERVDACFFYYDAMDSNGASHLVDLCNHHGVLICAGGLVFGTIAPIAYGIDMRKLRAYLVTYIDLYFRRNRLPNNHTIVLCPDEFLITVVNKFICESLRVRVPQITRTKTMAYDCEHDIARAMNASKRKARAFSQLSDTEKDIQKRGQKFLDDVHNRHSEH